MVCPGVITSVMQVCMICLTTHSKLSLISEQKLVEAYEKLIGHPLSNHGSLKQTLCILCTQRLRNFSRLREQSLRARSLMLDLIEKHGKMAMRHIELINREENGLKWDFVTSSLGPNHCDLNVEEYIVENKHTLLEENDIIVKSEEDSLSYEEKIKVCDSEAGEEDNDAGDQEESVVSEDSCDDSIVLHTRLLEEAMCKVLNQNAASGSAVPDVDPLKCEDEDDLENTIRQLTHEGSAQTSSALLSKLAKDNKNTTRATTHRSKQHLVIFNNRVSDSESNAKIDIKNGVVKLYDIVKTIENVVPIYDGTLPQTQTISSCYTLNADSATEKAEYRAASENQVATTHESAVSKLGKTEPSSSGSSLHTRVPNNSFTCDVCQQTFARRRAIVNHIKIHNKPYSCTLCDYKFAKKSALLIHIRTHTGEKPYSCKLCEYKCTGKSRLLRHEKTHTGEKPYACKLCKYKSALKGNLFRHERTHFNEKPYCCNSCDYKCAQKSNMLRHERTHTGEKPKKPYACTLCEYKCAGKSQLSVHMSIHTGEKPFACKSCEYKFAVKSHLLNHERLHTGEKPYACSFCNFKCSRSSNLATHINTHTGEKPYACKFCEFKCAQKSSLTIHERTHTGEKPYACKICEYKSVAKNALSIHERTHTGEKPYACNLCEYKCAQKSFLVKHLRKHTDEKEKKTSRKVICRYKR